MDVSFNGSDCLPSHKCASRHCTTSSGRYASGQRYASVCNFSRMYFLNRLYTKNCKSHSPITHNNILKPHSPWQVQQETLVLWPRQYSRRVFEDYGSYRSKTRKEMVRDRSRNTAMNYCYFITRKVDRIASSVLKVYIAHC